MFITRSLTFYPGYFEDNCSELSDEIILPSYYLNKIMEQFDDSEILYVNITNTETNQSYLVTIGSPHSYDKNTIFVPQWICDLIGCTGCCDSVITISKANVTEISPATKITIKPLDPVAFEINTQECFEKAFMNLHSIKEGITVPVNVPELGKDYIMFAYIEKVEPEAISRIVHGEVDVEFINEFKPLEPFTATTATSINSISTSTTTTFTDSITTTTTTTTMVPSETIVPLEDRRNKVREAWAKRFQNNVEQQ